MRKKISAKKEKNGVRRNKFKLSRWLWIVQEKIVQQQQGTESDEG